MARLPDLRVARADEVGQLDSLVPVFGLLRAGRPEQAYQLASDSVRREPQVGDHWCALSRALAAMGRRREATQAALRACELLHENLFVRAYLALCFLNEGAFQEAMKCADEVERLGPTTPIAWDYLGQVYAACEQHSRAQKAFNKACDLAPGVPHFAFNLATSLRNNGEFAQAERVYDRVIASARYDWEAYKNRSDLRVQTVLRNHIAELEALLSEPKARGDGEMLLHSALAKEYEDIGNGNVGYRHLVSANRLQRQRLNYSVGRDLAQLKDIARVYSAEVLAEVTSGAESEEPIFILGLPRAGSTLVERILGSHSMVHAAGELQHFPATLARLCSAALQAGRFRSRGNLFEDSLRLIPRNIGEAYIAQTRPHTSHLPHFIDKLPNNFLHIGAIHRALPRARIIHVLREPRDACYAIFKTLFKEGYPYSYDLEEVASYYIGYRGLMAHWHAVLPGRILDVSYEALVDDPVTVTRGILLHCNLEFEQGCLRFFESNKPTSTASAAQVRRPIYRSSVGRWEQFAAELASLTSRLEAAGYC
jgi:tetratricopeptide (TPR) repeat protein